MNLGGSLGKVPQKMKNLLEKLDIFRTVSPFSRIKFINIQFINCTLENRPAVRNISSCITSFSFLVERYLVTLLISLNHCEYDQVRTPTSLSTKYIYV
jgi:hypothetical protein